MPTFDNKTYVRPGHQPLRSVRLNKRISKRPVLLFGVPFISIILAGAYVLSNTQTVRYERRDNKVKLVSEEDTLGLEHGRRKVNAKEEYYRLQAKGLEDLDQWENKRLVSLQIDLSSDYGTHAVGSRDYLDRPITYWLPTLTRSLEKDDGLSAQSYTDYIIRWDSNGHMYRLDYHLWSELVKNSLIGMKTDYGVR